MQNYGLSAAAEMRRKLLSPFKQWTQDRVAGVSPNSWTHADGSFNAVSYMKHFMDQLKAGKQSRKIEYGWDVNRCAGAYLPLQHK